MMMMIMMVKDIGILIGDYDVDGDDDDWDGVQAGGGCSTSGKCPMQAPGSLTTPDLHPASIANEQKRKKERKS